MATVGTYVYVNAVSQEAPYEGSFTRTYGWTNLSLLQNNSSDYAYCSVGNTAPYGNIPVTVNIDGLSSYAAFAGYPIVSAYARVWAYASETGVTLEIEHGDGTQQNINLGTSAAYYDTPITSLQYGSDLDSMVGGKIDAYGTEPYTVYVGLIRYYVTYDDSLYGIRCYDAAGNLKLDSTVDSISRIVDYREFPPTGAGSSYQVDCGPADQSTGNISVFSVEVNNSTSNAPLKATSSTSVINGRLYCTVTLSGWTSSSVYQGVTIFNVAPCTTGVYVLMK